MKIILILLIAFGLSFPLIAHGQNETRSLHTCYTGVVVVILFGGIFQPNFNITMLYDPELKSMIKNYCNFYHEKTGIWLSLNDTEDKDTSNKDTSYKEVQRQFELKYNDSITHLRDKLIGVGK